MNWVRDFGAREGHLPNLRNVDNAAPERLRQELLDVFYLVAGETHGRIDADRDLYLIIEQSLGVQAAGNPQAGRRQRVGRDIGAVDWQRVYDLIVRLWPEFQRFGMSEVYRQNVNRVLAGHGIVWDLGDDGHLHRAIPAPVQAQTESAIAELQQARFEPSRGLFSAAVEAFDARPRRDRDCCSNIFDAMESVTKIVLNRPNDSFGHCLPHLRQRLNAQIAAVLEALNALRNRNFGHGMADPFGLTPAEVDFTYLSCISGMLLIARL